MATQQPQQTLEKHAQSSPESGNPGGGRGRRDETGKSGVYPAAGPLPPHGDAPIRTRAEWGQGGRGAVGYEDHGDSNKMMTLPSSDQPQEQRSQTHPPGPHQGTQTAHEKALYLTSPVFAANGPIPRRYTGEGEDVSPPLSWSGVPTHSKELALICDDPDAPQPTPWVHWVAYAIPPMLTGLPENAHENVIEGRNDFGRRGYNGPMPPPGHGVHHYHFRLYALDQSLQRGPGITKQQLLEAISGHVLAEGELVGTYERS
jgi:Raf kinase inhibitor-like YbhB/YbcL family protein